MNTYQIQVKGVDQQDLELFKKALNYHAGTLQFLLETMQKLEHAKDFSIAVELWYEMHKKTAVQHPAESPKVKLSLHKAYVLLDALKEYKTSGITDYDRSRCNRFYMVIDEQVPTFTQLSIQ